MNINTCDKLLTRYSEVIALVKDIIEWHKIAMEGTSLSLEEQIALYDSLYAAELVELGDEKQGSDAYEKEYADCSFVEVYNNYLTGCLGTLLAGIDELVDCGTRFEWLQKVTENNWSKFVPLDKELLSWPSELGHQVLYCEAETIEANSNGRYKGVTYSVVPTERMGEVVIFRDATGKILKPLSFVELEY